MPCLQDGALEAYTEMKGLLELENTVVAQKCCDIKKAFKSVAKAVTKVADKAVKGVQKVATTAVKAVEKGVNKAVSAVKKAGCGIAQKTCLAGCKMSKGVIQAGAKTMDAAKGTLKAAQQTVAALSKVWF